MCTFKSQNDQNQLLNKKSDHPNLHFPSFSDLEVWFGPYFVQLLSLRPFQF